LKQLPLFLTKFLFVQSLLPHEEAMIARAVLGIVILSICPCDARLSDTRVLCDEMKEHTADILTPHERVITLAS